MGAFVSTLRSMRRNLELPVDTSVAHNEQTKEVYIVTESGVLRRPLFILDESIASGRDRMRDMVARITKIWSEMGRRSSAAFFRELV